MKDVERMKEVFKMLNSTSRKNAFEYAEMFISDCSKEAPCNQEVSDSSHQKDAQ